jgi:hypothetical protein
MIIGAIWDMVEVLVHLRGPIVEQHDHHEHRQVRIGLGPQHRRPR